MSWQRISWIGEYQLGNLIGNQVPFLYLYISNEAEDLDHPLLVNARLQKPVGVVDAVLEKAADKQHPIVLICKNGELSGQAAENLIVAGYINVFVVKGGASGIS